MTLHSTRLTTLTAVSVALLVTTSACSDSAATDRAGGDTVVLKMATADGYTFGTTGGFLSGPETFATALEEVSGGRMRIDVAENYGAGEPGAESEVVEAIADGRLDGGWPATRAFEAAGINSLAAVEAPMLLTSSAAVSQLISGKSADVMLDSLDGTGVTGLALMFAGFRRPFANRMLLSPEDWSGARMRVVSPVQEAAVAALGGVPVREGTGWFDRLVEGKLDGGEFAIDGYAGNGYGTEAGNVPLNLVLWPRVFVLSLSTERYASLSDQQRSWLEQATKEALASSRSSAPQDQDFLPELCSRGVRFEMAAGWQLDELRTKLQPVLADLRGDPKTAPLMAEVDTIAAANPMPEPLTEPSDCVKKANAKPPTTPSELPDGVWRVEIPVQAVAEAGFDNNGGVSGTWTLTVEDSTFVLACTLLENSSKDCGNSGTSGTFEAGYLKGDGRTVHFVADEKLMQAAGACEDFCHVLDPYSAKWNARGDTLVFTDAGPSHLSVRPWARVAKG